MTTRQLAHGRGPLKLGLLLAGAVLVTSCASAGANSAPTAKPVDPDRVIDARLIRDHPAKTVASVPTAADAGPDSVVPAPQPVPESAPVVPSAPPQVLPGALPVVTIRAVGDGSVLVNDGRPCSSVSAASLGRGELEVHRSGTVDTALTVRVTTAGLALANGDVENPASEITIPAGAATASVWVTPTAGNLVAPVHVHRASPLTLAVTDTETYDLGAAATAAITVHVDVDLFGCATPAPAG
jgi:hypothetical protein